MHERSTDPDVVKRLQAETEWAVKARRRYVELTPDDAIALRARVEVLSTMLRAMARRAVGYRRNARRAVEREMSYKLSSGETVAQMRRDQTMGAFHKMRTERLQAQVELLTAALEDFLSLHGKPAGFQSRDEWNRVATNARAVLAKGFTDV